MTSSRLSHTRNPCGYVVRRLDRISPCSSVYSSEPSANHWYHEVEKTNNDTEGKRHGPYQLTLDIETLKGLFTTGGMVQYADVPISLHP